MAKVKRVGGNTKILKPNKGARKLINESQKVQLRGYKYDLQAKLRSDISGPHSGAVASQGRLSSFQITKRNTGTVKPAVTAKNVGKKAVKPKKKKGKK